MLFQITFNYIYCIVDFRVNNSSFLIAIQYIKLTFYIN